jgi:hypothetical protein
VNLFAAGVVAPWGLSTLPLSVSSEKPKKVKTLARTGLVKGNSFSTPVHLYHMLMQNKEVVQ